MPTTTITTTSTAKKKKKVFPSIRANFCDIKAKHDFSRAMKMLRLFERHRIIQKKFLFINSLNNILLCMRFLRDKTRQLINNL